MTSPAADGARRKRPYLVEGATLALVFASPLALGGTPPAAQALLAFAGVLLLGMHATLAARDERLRAPPAAAWALLGLGAWIMLRSLPGTGALGAPAFVDAWALWPTTTPRGLGAPAAGPLAALRMVGLAAIITVAAARFHRQRTIQPLLFAIGGAAALTVAAGVVQVALGSSRALLFYAPHHTDSLLTPLSGPFVNPNQAASLVGLGGVIALSVVWLARDNRLRALAFACFGAAWAYAVACGAFAAIAALGSATLLIALAVLGERFLSPRVAVLGLVTAAFALLAGAIVVGWFVLPGLSLPSPLTGADGKARVWNAAFGLLGDAPLTGFGPSTFGDIVPSVLIERGPTRHSFIESLPLQLAFDHGIPAALAVIAAFVVPLASQLASPVHRPTVARRALAIVVATYIGVESITGMAHQSMAYAIGGAMLFGASVGAHAASSRDASRPRPARLRAFAIAALALTVCVLPGLKRSLAAARPLDPPATLQLADTVLIDRAAGAPAEIPLIAIMASRSLVRDQLDDALARVAYLERAAPGYRLTWELAWATYIAADRIDDACRASREGGLVGFVPADLDLRIPRAVDRLACIPNTDAARSRFYDAMLRTGRDAEALAAAMRDIRQAPAAPALRAAATAAMRLGLFAEAGLHVTRLLEIAPDDELTFITASKYEFRTRNYAAAIEHLDAGIASHPRSVELRFARIESLAALSATTEAPGDWIETATADLEATRAQAVVEPALLRRHALLRAATAMAAGNPGDALAAASAIARRNPNDIEAMLVSAAAARAADRVAEARRWWMAVIAIDPENREAITGLRALDAGDGSGLR